MKYLDYNIRRVLKDDFEGVTKLFNSVFKKTMKADELIRKYSTNSFGEEFVAFIAEYNGEIVSFYGSIPHYLVNEKGVKFWVAQSSDAMTNGDHLRKGLFLELAKQNFDFCKEIGIQLIYGFPNMNSKPGFVNKLNWEFTNDMQEKIIDTGSYPFIFLKRKLPFLKSIIENYQLKKFNSLKVKPYPFKSANLKKGQLGVNKDEAYLSYKLNHKDAFFVKIAGKLLWLKFNEMYVLVGDLEDCPKEEFNQVIKGLKRLAKKIGIPHLRFNISGGSKLDEYLSEYSNQNKNKYSVGGIRFTNEIEFSDCKFTMADNDTF